MLVLKLEGKQYCILSGLGEDKLYPVSDLVNKLPSQKLLKLVAPCIKTNAVPHSTVPDDLRLALLI